MYNKQSILTNIIAVVLAFTMPLCCCIVKSATGDSDSCCSTSIQEEASASCCKQVQKSCCQKMIQGEEKESDSHPCNGDCGCTIKGTIYVQDWSPPVDLFGTETPAQFYVDPAILAVKRDANTFAHGPPKYNSSILGFSSAPPIRGTLILEV